MASALAGLFSVGQTATSPGIPVYNVPPLDQSAASTTPYATVFGTTMASGNSVFQAIPTAAAPVGALRFAAPTVMADIGNYNANTDRSCLNLGASAVNATSARLGVDPFVGVEDCIGVDIFTNLDASTPGAVAAWIHGGGFTQQDSSAFVYGDTNTDYFPDSGIVNVNIKYRLGPLGFLAHPELTAEAGQSGNYGLMDSIWALRWIKYNIANFKGDPTRVTVFGESAGGAHVMMVLASPIATGFFSRAIAQSPYISFGASTYSMSARESMGEYGATMAGCAPGVGQLACMRGIARTDDDFLKLASFINARDYNNYGLTSTIARPDIFLYNWVQSWPVVDGLYLTAAPLVAYAAGVNGAVDVIIGHVSDRIEPM